MRLLLVLWLAVSFPYVYAAGIPGVGSDLRKQYRIRFDTSNEGGCQGMESILEQAYEEAFNAAKIAQSSLAIIRQPRPNQNTDPVNYAKWGRIARVFSALFGAEEKTFQMGSKRYNVVAMVSDIFKQMTDDISANGILNGVFGRPVVSIYCSSGWLLRLRPQDIDPTDTQNPKRKISDTHPYITIGAQYSIPDQQLGVLSDSKFLADPCGGDGLAYTIKSLSAITFCPQTLSGSGEVKTSLVQQKILIQPNDSIGDHRTVAEMWLHEWVHLLASFEDEQVVDSKGDTVTAYGWTRVAKLAQDDRFAAQRNPDSFVIFANCMFFDNFDWSTGRAVVI